MHDHRRNKYNEVYLIVVIALCLSKIVHGFITVPRMSPSGDFSSRRAADGKLMHTPHTGELHYHPALSLTMVT